LAIYSQWYAIFLFTFGILYYKGDVIMAENRDLKATPGIPEKNRVVGEIPMKKAEYYGYFDSEPSTKEIINQIETAVKNSVTEKKSES
jgi:hypothetical protein